MSSYKSSCESEDGQGDDGGEGMRRRRRDVIFALSRFTIWSPNMNSHDDEQLMLVSHEFDDLIQLKHVHMSES